MINEKLSCIVIDDEPLGKEIIINYVKTIPFLDLKDSFEDPLKAVTYLNLNSVDLIISDINMPTINGIDLIKSLTKQPAVIFITAHRDFAIDGFENGVVDFLVKPVAYNRFVIAINRAKERIEASAKRDLILSNKKQPDHIFIKAGGKLIKIILNDILYVEALGDYLKIVTNTESHTTLATLKSMEIILKEPVFSRVQRSFIVKITSIKSISGNMVELINGKSIAIAANKKDELFSLLGI
ncbi:LytTR family transcriptional regulator [Chryseobacterium sp. Leaf404]|uniref:LytR/AlgR family response regulator transcription factor n=1 Tax=unclassified Chryseobacterium TaxID=2593645 RepID=UPI0006F52AD2|nr:MULTISPECIES: LytTR family DNA-binding domain-containing protein [unclassified Chryseobacterium]KQT19025.1 LytTR family transcriptional regulator [Chryseobacterium sp. Leaf404]